MKNVCSDIQPATRFRLKFLRWLLPASLISVAMVSGCTGGSDGEQGVGSGESRSYSSIAENSDSDAIVDKTSVNPAVSSIIFHDGKLSVSLDAIPLQQVVAEVSRHTGIDIQFIGEPPAIMMDMHFSNSRLESGLRLLLDDVNTIFMYANSGKAGNDGEQLAKILILSEGEKIQVGDATMDVIDTLSVITGQIHNSVSLSNNVPNQSVSTNDVITDQALQEFAETLRQKIPTLVQSPELKKVAPGK